MKTKKTKPKPAAIVVELTANDINTIEGALCAMNELDSDVRFYTIGFVGPRTVASELKRILDKRIKPAMTPVQDGGVRKARRVK